MLRISLIFYIFAPLKKENDMAEIANRIYETSEGQILFISDFSDINDNEKVVSRALSVEEKKGNIVRLANGVYLRPKNTRFGIVYPSIDEMVMAIAQRDKVQIAFRSYSAQQTWTLNTGAYKIYLSDIGKWKSLDSWKSDYRVEEKCS